MDFCGIGSDALRLIPGMNLAELETAIDEDRRAGFTPFLLVGTAGSVDTGAIDDLTALAAVSRRERRWFHVDGACGALAVLAPDLAPRLRGIERRRIRWHSTFTNGGRSPMRRALFWCAMACCTARLSPCPRLICGASSPDSRAARRGPATSGPTSRVDFARLKTWFTLKVYGTDALAAAIARTCALARYLESRIESAGRWNFWPRFHLNIVLFPLSSRA